ncbi:MAG: FAD-linked oxidase C-terminal domain-containing protein [Anaerolineae bacterium]|nr:FAD-binding protein [Anaerolineae bacterium]MDW8102594.1 FAD-linked oxidase C-terminal domain-containing protein [Anaerolineae bacterium]
MLAPQIIRELKKIVGEKNVLTSPEDLIAYSYDATFLEHRPDAVVLPGSTEEVSEVMKVAYREGLPVIPRGMGSGLAGGSIPFSGGVVLALTRMNRILEIDEENMTAWVEAGIITAEFQAEVEKRGLFYPPDPSSHKYSTIGGNVACNAGGPRCLKYGVTGDYVLGMKVVLADGRILKTGGKVIKNVTGYNLSHLFIGTEGTLGVITEVLLKLISKPRYVSTAFAVFPNLEDAGRAVHRILLAGITPASIELMDQTTIGTVEEYLHLGLPTWAEAILILEADGNQEEAVLREIEAIARICRENGAVEVKVARDEAERNSLWKARRSVSPSLARRAPNKLGEDITVPRSRIPEAVRRIREISQKYGLPVVVFGHAGDGNLHPNILFDKRRPEDMEKVEKIAGEIFKMAVEMGGVLSGEHGVGILKQPYLEMAVGPVAVEIMKAIKQALDPKGILNPGKVVPLGVSWRGE